MSEDYPVHENISEYYDVNFNDEQNNFGEAAEATFHNDNNNEAGTTQRINPARTYTRRYPRSQLNVEKLKGRNGVQVIEEYYSGFKFNGREQEDLDRIMKRLELWSQKIDRKYNFDDFLARVEQLGSKKDMHVHIKKYRLDMITSDNDMIINNDDSDNEKDQQESAPIDDFDSLITEQIQKQKQAEAAQFVQSTTSNEDAFNELLAQSNSNTIIPNSQASVCPSTAKTELSDEMKEKIERNKQLAMQRKLERQKEREQETNREKLIEDTSTHILNQHDSNTSNTYDEIDESQLSNIQSQLDETANKIISNELKETSFNSQDY